MSVRYQDIAVTGPAGTVVSQRPISGQILEISYGGTALNATPVAADYTITRTSPDGGTIWSESNVQGPFTRSPRANAVTTTGTGGTAIAQIPVDGQVRVVIAQGGTATDNIRVYYKGE